MGRLNFCFLLVLFFVDSLSLKSQELYSYELIDSISVEFRFGTAEILNTASVHSLLKNLEVDEYTKIILNGYTDSIGSLKYNESLANKRLNEVAHLIKSYHNTSSLLQLNNKNKQRLSDNLLIDSLFRRVDVIVYHYQLNVPLGKNYPLQIQFGGSSAFLLPSSKGLVEEIAVVLRMDTTLNIELQGHISGNEPDYELSLNRALSVKKYLVELGIAEERINCRGMSNEHKLYPEISEKNRALNRRVEIVLSKKL